MAASCAPLAPFRRRCGALAALTVLWALVLLLAGAESAVARDVSNVGLSGIALAAGIAAVRRARRTDQRLARFWRLLGGYALLWSGGQAAWTVQETVLGRPDLFPSVADIGYLGAVPLAVLALLALPLAAPTLAGRARTVLDGAMVAGSLLLISYFWLLRPVMSGDHDRLSMAVLLAYPLADVVLITLTLYTMLRARQQQGRVPAALPLVGVGILAICVGDSGFAYLNATESYWSGHPVDIGWFLGFALLLLAAWHPGADTEACAAAGELSQPIGIVLPYLAVTAGLATSLVELAQEGETGAFVGWVRATLFALLIGRQLLTLRENHRLTQHLEERVEARTAELAASEQRFAALVQHSSDVVTIIDDDGVVQYHSPSSLRIFGVEPAQVVGASFADLTEAEDRAGVLAAFAECAAEPYRTLVHRSRWRDGRGVVRHVEITMTNLLEEPAVAGVVLNTRDLTEHKVLQDQLVHQAFHDSLTALANRALFKERIEQALAVGGGTGSAAVLFLDLDGFKAVNDNLGHSAGDQLLTLVAERLRAAVRPCDTIARLGGDEFAILVQDITGEAALRDLAERITVCLEEPVVLLGQEIHPRGSIGIAARTGRREDAEQLLRNADLAMYRAKSAGGGFAQYDPAMHADLVQRFRLESDLRRAIDQDELEVHYQPLIDLRGGHITGVEALVRWRHPERGLVPPDAFIPLAEQTGLIDPLGEWVLHEACRQTAEWQRSSPLLADLQLNVNMSPRQLLRPDLPDRVAEALHRSGMPARTLVLEMTESILMDHSDETLASLQALKQLGLRLAIDDFGTGYSSLSYLHRFPVDVLKIDRSFIERLSGETSLVSTIVQLGRAMRLETVAEGIEDSDQFAALRRLGCTTGQGYHIARPLPGPLFGSLLADWAVPAPQAPATIVV